MGGEAWSVARAERGDDNSARVSALTLRLFFIDRRAALCVRGHTPSTRTACVCKHSRPCTQPHREPHRAPGRLSSDARQARTRPAAGRGAGRLPRHRPAGQARRHRWSHHHRHYRRGRVPAVGAVPPHRRDSGGAAQDCAQGAGTSTVRWIGRAVATKPAACVLLARLGGEKGGGGGGGDTRRARRARVLVFGWRALCLPARPASALASDTVGGERHDGRDVLTPRCGRWASWERGGGRDQTHTPPDFACPPSPFDAVADAPTHPSLPATRTYPTPTPTPPSPCSPSPTLRPAGTRARRRC